MHGYNTVECSVTGANYSPTTYSVFNCACC